MNDIIHNFQPLQDGLDILIVAVVVYQVIVVLRRSNAFSMMLGIVFLLGLYIISERIGLVTVRWLLSTFLSSAVLLVIVVFQNDIRRALSFIGTPNFFRTQKLLVESRTIDEICKAVLTMARERTGALIVLPRIMALDEYTTTGMRFGAEVSEEALLAVFNKNSPLHDGAVIISHGTIETVSCILPITANATLPQELGTRHRAAIGLSEQTDAVVIVVSEERGEISIVKDGGISQRRIDEGELRKVLHAILSAPSEAGA